MYAEAVEQCEHWCPAHRAAYRKGTLVREDSRLIWVPNHKRGNAELGTVKQDFCVKRILWGLSTP
jgi:hypothetical protein